MSICDFSICASRVLNLSVLSPPKLMVDVLMDFGGLSCKGAPHCLDDSFAFICEHTLFLVVTTTATVVCVVACFPLPLQFHHCELVLVGCLVVLVSHAVWL